MQVTLEADPHAPRDTFSKAERICLNREIDVLFASREGFSVYPLRLVYCTVPPSTAPVKVLITVPKRRIRHAVDRNRVKRCIREAYRKQKHALVETMLQRQETLLIGVIYLADTVRSSRRIASSMQRSLSRLVEQMQQTES